MKKIFIIFSVIAVSVILSFLTIITYISKQSQQDTKVKSDVIMVLGGRAYSGDSCVGPICKQINFVPSRHYNPCIVSRVNQAVELYKEQYAPKILMSGGDDKEDNANEAETMKKIAMEAGVPETDILTENTSTSTYENFAFSQKILQQNNLQSIIIVTDPNHIARAGLVASKLNYKYTQSPAKEMTCTTPTKESLNIIGYKLLNKI